MINFIQNCINTFYRYPKARIREVERFGGKKVYEYMLAQKLEMVKAARNIDALPRSNGALSVYFLTGKKYIDQTLFCICSLEKSMSDTFKYILVDDGTFDEDLKEFVTLKIPNATIIAKSDIFQNLERHLPFERYPVLRKKRDEYPHIKKLTDIHTLDGGKGFKLVLDSDMLFNHPPIEIRNWLEHPDSPIHMIDCAEAYGYEHSFLERVCGAEVPKLVNVGVFGIDSAAINWSDLERWTNELEARAGASYYLEQALSAMLIAEQETVVLDRENYLVNPSEDEIHDCKATLHHYVDLSKKGYYTKAWKKFV